MWTFGSRPGALTDARVDELLAEADDFTAQPLNSVMEQFGLSLDQARSWQGTVARLAAQLRRDLGS
jgi:hypothetical protein